MKRRLLISTLSLATVFGGIHFTSPVSASFRAPAPDNDTIVMEISEILQLRSEIISGVEAACRESEEWKTWCARSYMSEKKEEDPRYVAAEAVFKIPFTISSFNLEQRTMRVFLNTKQLYEIGPGQDSINEIIPLELRIGWYDFRYPVGNYWRTLPKDESEAPDNFYYLYNGEAKAVVEDEDGEGNEWIVPNTQYTIHFDNIDDTLFKTPGDIYYTVIGENDYTYTSYNSVFRCLESDYYVEGEEMECRAIYSTDPNNINIVNYVPFRKDGTPAYPDADYKKPNPSTGDSGGESTSDPTPENPTTPDPENPGGSEDSEDPETPAVTDPDPENPTDNDPEVVEPDPETPDPNPESQDPNPETPNPTPDPDPIDPNDTDSDPNPTEPNDTDSGSTPPASDDDNGTSIIKPAKPTTIITRPISGGATTPSTGNKPEEIAPSEDDKAGSSTSAGDNIVSGTTITQPTIDTPEIIIPVLTPVSTTKPIITSIGSNKSNANRSHTTFATAATTSTPAATSASASTSEIKSKETTNAVVKSSLATANTSNKTDESAASFSGEEKSLLEDSEFPWWTVGVASIGVPSLTGFFWFAIKRSR